MITIARDINSNNKYKQVVTQYLNYTSLIVIYVENKML